LAFSKLETLKKVRFSRSRRDSRWFSWNLLGFSLIFLKSAAKPRNFKFINFKSMLSWSNLIFDSVFDSIFDLIWFDFIYSFHILVHTTPNIKTRACLSVSLVKLLKKFKLRWKSRLLQYKKMMKWWCWHASPHRRRSNKWQLDQLKLL
jgi:hypothetical protein